MTLIKIDAKDHGLEETKAVEISNMFKPMLDKMEELEAEFNKIQKEPLNESKTKKAKELRLKYVKVRTGTAKIHKEIKAFYLAGGRFVDGWKNAQSFISEGKEQKLAEIEKHFENIELERISKLAFEREEELNEYDCVVIPKDLGKMDDTVYSSFLAGTIKSFEDKKEAERLAIEEAEKQRMAEQKAAELKRLEDIEKEKEFKRIAEENAELKRIADEKEAARQLELKKIQEQQAKEKAKQDAKLKDAEEKLKLELEEKKKLEDEKKRIENERLKEEKKAQSAPDKNKIFNFIESFELLKRPELTTDHGAFLLEKIEVMLEKIKIYVIDASEKF